MFFSDNASAVDHTVPALDHMDPKDQTVASYPAMGDNHCEQFKLFLYLLLGFICLIGFAGNIASFCVLQKDRTSATATFLLRALAVADTAFLVIWTLNYSIRQVVIYLGFDESVVWLYIRVCSFPCLYITQTLTIWLMVVVACNRLIVVCMPCRAHRLCCLRNFQVTVALVVVGAVLSNAPRFFEIQLVMNETKGAMDWQRTSFSDSGVYRIVYTDIVYYLLTFVLPLIAIGFTYARVISTYRASRRLQWSQVPAAGVQQTSGGGGGPMNENAITLVMIVIVAIFVVCQAPSRLVQAVYGYRFDDCHQLRFYLIHVSNGLEMFNSSVNFFVYVAFYKRFRLLLRRGLCRGGPLRDSDRTATTEGLYLEEQNWETTPDNQIPKTTEEAPYDRLLPDGEGGRGSGQGSAHGIGHGDVPEASSDDEHLRLNADFKTPIKAIVLCD